MSVAKSWWKWGPKMAKMLKNGNGSWFFKNFGKKLRNFATGNGNRVQKCLKTLVFEKNPRCFSKNFEKLPVFSKKTETETGNQLIFQIFQGFTRFVAKSCELLPQETEIGSKIAWKPWFLKKTRAFLAKTLKNCLFFQKKSPETEIEGLETLNLAQKSNFSRLHLSILAKSCGFLPPETEMGSKNA